MYMYELGVSYTFYFRKNIKDDSVIFFMEVECIGNTQIIHVEET